MSVTINDEHFDFDVLSKFDLASFIHENKYQKPETFLLQSKYNTKKLNWFLAEQLKAYPKAVHKLPTFTSTHCWFTSKSYEQSSSESSALFKSSLFNGGKILDLSGGLGVDDWAFAKSFEQVVSLDPDSELNAIVRLNWLKLNLQNCNRLTTTAEAYLKTHSGNQFDLIYLDADRRSNTNRQSGIEGGTPNFFEIKEELFKMSGKILLKLSPLIDINYCMKTLPHLNTIWIVSVQQEVKEILCYLENSSNKASASIHVIEIDKKGIVHELKQINSIENLASNEKQGITETVFFEPSSALIKSGLTLAHTKKYQLAPIGINTLYFTGKTPIIELKNHGRFFKLIHQETYNKRQFLTYLIENKIELMTISTRNFGMDAEALTKVLKIKPGGDDYFFFGKNTQGIRLFFHCKKLPA